MKLKSCSKCGEAKDLTLFNRNRQQRDGYHVYCKACQAWYAAERYKRNKLEINRQNTNWYRTNREKRLAAMKKKRTGELFNMKNRIYAGNRRARQKGQSDGTVTYDAISRLLEEQNWECADCGKDLGTIERHLDHVKPLVLGGMHSIANLQWLCQKCNLSKGGRVW